MFKDRRVFERLENIVNVRYAVRDRDKGKIESVPKNIGGGGIAVCLHEKLQSGTVVDLEITVPDNPKKTIVMVGEVLWTKPFGVIRYNQSVDLYETGIKFIDKNPLGIGRVYTYFREQRHI